MGTQHPPAITSFVIRFVVQDRAQKTANLPAYRGSIHHVQSDETLNFSVWQDAVEFIQRYVPLESPKQE
jgi:hypothetical protein